MSYNKVNNNSKSISYLDKDFDSLKTSLINLARIYFPDTINDFSEASPGTMFIEMASYIGDILSFYTDAQIQEIFIQHAQQRKNLFAMAYNLGYVPSVTSPSSVELEVFQQIPSNALYEPDYDYALRIAKNSIFKTNNGSNVKFLTQDSIDFSVSSSSDPTELSVWTIDSGTNKPSYYLLKKKVKAISAEIITKTFDIGGPERFKKISLTDTDIIGIESITDSDNNTWYEVPYLAQETIFEEVPNNSYNDPDLPQYGGNSYLLKLRRVPKRFATRFKADDTLEIQFGAGISSGGDTDIIPNPDNVGLGIKDGRSLIDLAYDPSNFLYTKAYGEVPSNTTLTVRYMRGGGVISNVPPNSINRVDTLLATPTKGNLDSTLYQYVLSSVASTNPGAATGGGDGDTTEDIRLNAIASFATQKRTVTKSDYLFRALSMPSKFGRVAKVHLAQDTQISLESSKRISNPNALNLYVLGYDINKKLNNLSYVTKTNLATYLEQYRMLTDSINIKDAYILNMGVNFEIITSNPSNNDLVLVECINVLKNYFNIDKWQINQPVNHSEVINLLYNVSGVHSVPSLSFVNINGVSKGYSNYKYDFDVATRDGVLYPPVDPSIFEVKYPNRDIKGKVKTI